MWNPISSVPWKDMSEKDVKHESKNETHGWCKTTVKLKARTKMWDVEFRREIWTSDKKKKGKEKQLKLGEWLQRPREGYRDRNMVQGGVFGLTEEKS